MPLCVCIVWQRLRAAAAKKKEETIDALQSDIFNFETLKQRRNEGVISQAEFSATIKKGGFSNEEDFEQTYPHTEGHSHTARPTYLSGC